MRTLIAFVLGAALWIAGCGGDGDETRGRGSPACQDFQDAFCDFAVDRCGLATRGSCDAPIQSIECRSDEAASACANAFNQATCGQAVTSCKLNQVINTQPAVARCERVMDAVCDHLMACGQVPDRSACSTTPSVEFDCSSAIGSGLGYEDCLKQLAEPACESALPDICSGVIVILPPSVLATI